MIRIRCALPFGPQNLKRVGLGSDLTSRPNQLRLCDPGLIGDMVERKARKGRENHTQKVEHPNHVSAPRLQRRLEYAPPHANARIASADYERVHCRPACADGRSAGGTWPRARGDVPAHAANRTEARRCARPESV